MSRASIIVEVGSNYDGDLALAKDYVHAAAEIGADIVKFQTLRKRTLVAREILNEGVWIANPVWDNFSNLELPDEWHGILNEEAQRCGIEFMSTPFDLSAVELLEEVGVQRYKVASGDMTFDPLLRRIGETGKPVFLSTGASSLDEVACAVSTLQEAGTTDVTLLHCVVSYPPQWDEVNLRAMCTLAEQFNTPVGISDHTPGTLVAIAAVALGAKVVEKHMTFDRTRKGPDHAFAMTVDEVREMIIDIRRLESALGNGVKEPTPSERERCHRFRRSPYDPATGRPTNSPDGLWLRPEAPREQ